MQQCVELRMKAYRTVGFMANLPPLPKNDWEKLRITTMNKKVVTNPGQIALTSPNNQIQEKKVSHCKVMKENFILPSQSEDSASPQKKS